MASLNIKKRSFHKKFCHVKRRYYKSESRVLITEFKQKKKSCSEGEMLLLPVRIYEFMTLLIDIFKL